jgi:hypothetical protein
MDSLVAAQSIGHSIGSGAAVDVTSGIEQAVAELEPGGQLLGVFELTGGVSANVLGLEIATSAEAGGGSCSRQHRSADFKQHGHAVTVTESTNRCSDGPYLILDWVDGSTELAPDDVPAALDQTARFLVGLHSLGPSSLQFPDSNRSRTCWRRSSLPAVNRSGGPRKSEAMERFTNQYLAARVGSGAREPPR